MKDESQSGSLCDAYSARLAELQFQLAAHWCRISRVAAELFAMRDGAVSGPRSRVDDPMERYALWIECAEQAYAEGVRTEEYCRLQAELANAALRLLLQMRSQASRDVCP